MTIGIAMALDGASAHLGAAVRSILAFGDDIEIAIADASGDPRTRSAFAPLESKITAYFAEPDSGQADGLAKAFDALQSPILAWLNDDDFLVAGGAARVEAAMANADLVHGEALFFDAVGAAIGYHPNVSADPATLSRANTIAQPSCFFSRALYRQVRGLKHDLHYVMDWDLWLRMRDAGATMQHLPALLSGVTMSRTTKTSQPSARRYAEVAALIRTQGSGAIGALVSAARVTAGGLRWALDGGETPPHPYFRLWSDAGGVQHAALASEQGIALFHTETRAIDAARIEGLDHKTACAKLTGSAEPFVLFSLPSPIAARDIRKIQFAEATS